MPQVTGQAKVTINGVLLDTMKGVTLNPGGTKRNPVTTALSHHFSQELAPAHLEFEKSQVKGDSIDDLDLDDATIQVAFDTGQTYVMNHAFRLDPADLSDEGKSKYVFESGPAEEIL